MGKIDVSVVVLTYNQEKTVGRTLESILNQNHTCTFEIIIGDDASTDHTRFVCEEYAQKFPEIIKINAPHKNLGVVSNYEETINRCSGTYRMGCAGDDWWSNPNKMQYQFDYMESHPNCVLHYGGFTEYYEATGQSKVKKPIKIKGELFECLLQINPICAPTSCIRMSAFRKYDFHDFIKEGFLVEDWPNWLALSQYGTFDTTDDSLVTYTIAYGTLHNNKKFDTRKRYLDNFHEMRKYFARLRGKEESYRYLIDNVYYRSVGDAAVKYGQRKTALSNYKQIKNKDRKTWMKLVCCLIPVFFNMIHAKMNKNM
jgi:glycosyltransferase involved in cell wall biosynthesis